MCAWPGILVLSEEQKKERVCSMTIIEIILLAGWAALDTALVVWSPARKYAASVQGLSKHEVDRMWEQPGYAATGCNLVASVVAHLFIKIFVEPGYLIWALSAHVGLPWVAKVVLMVWVVDMVDSAVLAMRGCNRKTFSIIRWWRWVLEWFFSIPALYLWYLLMVICGLMR